MSCPSVCATRKPVPSLPVLGTDKPPVAMITAPACSVSPSRSSTRHPASTGPTSLTVVFSRSCRAAALRELQKPIADIAGALGCGKELCRFDLLDERQPELALEERDLLAERPRANDSTDEVRRRVAHEPRFVEARREDIAAAAAADQDLAAAVSRALEKKCVGAGGGSENRRHRPGRAGADDDDAAAISVRCRHRALVATEH